MLKKYVFKLGLPNQESSWFYPFEHFESEGSKMSIDIHQSCRVALSAHY